jgi:polysaccharide export outer membrane protein
MSKKAMKLIIENLITAVCFVTVCSVLSGCQTNLPLIEKAPLLVNQQIDYHIGPGDNLQIFVWRNPEFSVSVPVRPDGKISIPLIEDIMAAHETPAELSKNLEVALSHYLKEPIVTVMVSNFVGTYEDSIRVVGEASQPQAIPYRTGMTLLDIMILVGGLTDFADGNRATLVRHYGMNNTSYRARLEDLLNDGDISANAKVLPGDVLIIPEAFF